MNIPDEQTCRTLWAQFDLPLRVRRHCEAVMLRACALLEEFEGRWDFDEDLVVAGALLHDLCRTQPHHEAAAAEFLNAMNMPEVARVVGCHMHLSPDMEAHVDERAVVFLADKLVMEDQPCTIAARYMGAVLKGAPVEAMEKETARVQAFYARLAQAPLKSAQPMI